MAVDLLLKLGDWYLGYILPFYLYMFDIFHENKTKTRKPPSLWSFGRNWGKLLDLAIWTWSQGKMMEWHPRHELAQGGSLDLTLQTVVSCLDFCSSQGNVNQSSVTFSHFKQLVKKYKFNIAPKMLKII